MSAANVTNTLYRQWLLLQHVPQIGEGASNAELRQFLMDEGLDVTLRTVQRDMESICQRFPIYSTIETKPLRWRWMDNRKIDIQGVSINEALSLMLVESTMRQLLPGSVLKCLRPSFEHARQVLQAMKSQSDVAGWFEKVGSVPPGMSQKPPLIDETVLSLVQDALLKDQTLQVQYQAAHQPIAKVYQLLPLALVQRGVMLYLVAQVMVETAIKLFAMHRIKGVTTSDLHQQRPATFTLSSYLQSGAMQFSNGQQVQLQARVSAMLADHLSEAPLSDDMQLTVLDDEHFQLQATVHDSWQLSWWLLSYSDQIEVLAPETLRQSTKAKLQAALAQYQ
ncbi:WYL domain-containing protein [Shewanella sp. A32]|uniref:helix-turn-helix transcriptional regulator n=1 Tax=Shewanella sp. A32 TaxID=3031327 RepID=UPI0023B9FF96|nr:WYL domain-containing protein [Shewanella sp. A32]MDF0534683.1 WYL domain-containing protein [Shewanella sp. A32]